VALFYSHFTDAFCHAATPAIGELEEQFRFLNGRLILKGILPTEFKNGG
jgi:hypothetical protein